MLRVRCSLILILCVILSVSVGCKSKATVVSTEEGSSSQAQETIAPEQNLLTTEDAKLLDQMSPYRFFVGDVVIEEDQQWQSNYEDGSHGDGDAVLRVKELVAFEMASRKAFIVVRSLDYVSEHLVTVNDMQGNFIGQKPVDARGTLTEFYGLGEAVLRMDATSNRFYTRPATINSQWVAYRSTADTVRWSIERIGPPEYGEDINIGDLATRDTLSNTKTYGNRNSAIYEATRRFWQVKGEVRYDYRRVEAQDALDYLKDQMAANREANAYVSPTALNQVSSEYKLLWETLDELAKNSFQALSAGQLLDKLPSGNPIEISQMYQKKLDQAVNAMLKVSERREVFAAHPNGDGFLEEFKKNLAALEQNPFRLELLLPFENYLQNYEVAIQINDLKSLLADGFVTPKGPSLDLSSAVDLPSDYPKSVLPLPAKGRLVLAEALEPKGYNLTFIDQTPEETLSSFYRGVLSDKKDFNEMKVQGMVVMTATSNPWLVSVMISPNLMTDEGGFMVNLTVTQE